MFRTAHLFAIAALAATLITIGPATAEPVDHSPTFLTAPALDAGDLFLDYAIEADDFVLPVLDADTLAALLRGSDVFATDDANFFGDVIRLGGAGATADNA